MKRPTKSTRAFIDCQMCGASMPAGATHCTACGEGLPTPVAREDWPWLVQMGLWGLPNRTAAWGFFWFSTFCGAISLGLAWLHPLFLLGTLMFLASLWYYTSIVWVDEHDGWP